LTASIPSLGALEKFKQLQTLSLDFSDSNIDDLKSLQNLNQINTLNLDLNYVQKIPDLGSLKKLKQLTTLNLNLSENEHISDLSTLRSLEDKKITLNLKGTQVDSIKGISNLIGLELGN